MPTPRKHFGRRGLAQQSVTGWGNSQTRYGTAAPAYAAPGYGSDADEGTGMSLAGIGSVFGMLFSFQGRIGRMEYWGIGIVRFFLMIAAAIAYATSLPANSAQLDSAAVLGGFMDTGTGMIYLVAFVALTVCLFSLEVRRCHDRDASGLWILIMFIPIIGAFFALYLFVVNGFFPGTQGPNRFDTARSQAAVFD